MTDPAAQEVAGRPRLGISACLLGRKVRYDGGHKHDRFLTDTLGRFVDWVPVCPEVECGLPTPREAMQLQGDPDRPKLVTSRTGRDLTEQMLAFARRRVRELEREDLVSFVLKSRSPSCGLSVAVGTSGEGLGLFARELRLGLPALELLQETDLQAAEAQADILTLLGGC